jgi:hypothetical protein
MRMAKIPVIRKFGISVMAGKPVISVVGGNEYDVPETASKRIPFKARSRWMIS